LPLLMVSSPTVPVRLSSPLEPIMVAMFFLGEHRECRR